ncbi:hypothetical protein GCM10022199_03410 [Marihabitans asiaticum]|uniref:Thiamine transport system ATP-binding protein n=1 Tax=Marihabitans asiaticum TaxID=415218 RepID=A0A560WEP3_9MICO|nr:thiamine transport system ATP-binding protein [Marihabitans asiaticum]
MGGVPSRLAGARTSGSGKGLRCEDVSVTFGELRAVDHVDLAVAPGEVVAVLGPSGCGKSTLLRAVAGLEPLASGRVLWHGEDLAGTATHRRGFAMMFQDGQLFGHLSVARNVGYGARLRGLRGSALDAEVARLLDLVGLSGRGEDDPLTLSGGQQQRVALARSLGAGPRLILLDEPLSALDRELRERLAADLRSVLADSGTSAILVTHDHGEAEVIADRVVQMEAGRLASTAP